ncbi:MAG TPA: rRNA (cytidine-2'-O-)-methyltransferase, partial [Aquificae bacterium]|nr:rRNA (cytidine-2'-O-)-methyltransferase [Aquificota bacterium]
MGILMTFFIVSTPIGNIEDISLRALKTLENLDILLCEDTRQTKKLLTLL